MTITNQESKNKSLDSSAKCKPCQKYKLAPSARTIQSTKPAPKSYEATKNAILALKHKHYPKAQNLPKTRALQKSRALPIHAI
ncbi:hypothetical protein BKN38_00020 [Helicobacter sp. CLO-3]|uniref:hypothetical protein n=1 Tax=unclassified Helicobacter TaxID=2593540 RepID=UPI000805AA2C|nr:MULTISPECIES: hypothetical protein [unclassified Helicobacter]OBV28764.1 hypothetical protein BA723_01420 [Helicobacter sp. CLO-3]OHU85834.1 hypothetical protein BKN38_00020 [Helicobacter sp. CLO-3]